MAIMNPGLIHAPVTPFAANGAVDYDAYARLVRFHLAHGADSIALPLHVGESVSLKHEERQRLLDTALAVAARARPVLAHVSDSGTAIAAARARDAERAGAAAIIATVPYYWTPPAAMVLEHFATIATAVSLPFYVLYTPREMPGVKIGTDLLLKLMDRAANVAGVIDASLDWQSMINLVSAGQRRRADFQLLSGSDYLISASAIGACGFVSALAGIAPRMVRRAFETCRAERYADARAEQETIAALAQAVKRAGNGGIKTAMRLMGRDCGLPRPPLEGATPAATSALAADLERLLAHEPKGW